MSITIHLAVPAASTHDCTTGNQSCIGFENDRRRRGPNGRRPPDGLGCRRERLEALLEMDEVESLVRHVYFLNSGITGTFSRSAGGIVLCRGRYHGALRRLPTTLLAVCWYLRLHDYMSRFVAAPFGTVAQYGADLVRTVKKNIPVNRRNWHALFQMWGNVTCYAI
ncbi:hypothetical protein QA646_05435 [Rhizobium sp. CB3090]|uniref:hypothetical protein n=1 Tax=Rhizobium sp. CB3090 TaxID=3039156 RepID=UPI0024B1E993|nr:hypothetical protein [Rhizobium sp. CB3090]WFU10301.1 hypothetical protein QA646_05435 [Rhizobium sp. CB3090]